MRLLCAAAVLLTVIAGLSAIAPFGSEASFSESDGAVFEYKTAGSGTAGSPYESTLLSVSSSEEVLTIPSALEGYPLRYITGGGGCLGVKALVIPKTVLRISSEAFSGFADLERVYFTGDRPDMEPAVFPPGTELLHSQPSAGWGESSAVYYTGTAAAGDSVISYAIIEGYATVTGLVHGTDVRIPKTVSGPGGSVAVTELDQESFRYSGVVSVVLPEGIKRIGTRAFYGCETLESAVIPDSLETVCDEAFRECPSLGNVNLGNIRFIGFEAFRMCGSFTSLIIPDTVTVMREGAFRVCPGVRVLVIGSGISEIPASCFDYYAALESLEIKGKITVVGSNAFYVSHGSDNRLVSADLSDAVSIGGSAFVNRIALEEVILGNSLESIGSEAFSGCRGIVSITFPETLKSIGDNAFYDCRSLRDAYFLGNMPTIGEGAFSGDTAIHTDSAHAGSWADYGGNVVIDGKSGTAVPIAVAIAFSAAVLFTLLFMLRRHRN
ncbi:MAG: leucine-rich repeat domain-containing protein [Candidatus Methanoplasma sp.]|jgi:hypothetical protein|nr:leucine-rich repeat domain-containing protein [Candidatus Methanoplasma sp.]